MGGGCKWIQVCGKDPPQKWSTSWGCFPFWPESPPCWINHDKVQLLHTSFSLFFIFFFYPFYLLFHRSFKCALEKLQKIRGETRVEVVGKSLFPWRRQTTVQPAISCAVLTLDQRWYLTSMDEWAAVRGEESTKLPRLARQDGCLYHLDAGPTTACLQMTLLGVIY